MQFLTNRNQEYMEQKILESRERMKKQSEILEEINNDMKKDWQRVKKYSAITFKVIFNRLFR